MTAFIASFAFVMGAIVGSFLNVCIYRMPKEQSVVFPGSHCFGCKKPIAWFDNIPIFSYFILRGKCRNCKTGFSAQYAFVEFLTGATFVLFYLYFGLTAKGFTYLAFTVAMIVVSAIDFEHRIIPDEISLSGIVIALGLSAAFPGLHNETEHWPAFVKSFLGFLIGGGFLYTTAVATEFFVKKEAMGGGDIKLIAMIGALFGLPGAIWTIFMSSVLGSVVGVYQRVRHGEMYIPFGPFLALAAVSYPFVGERAIQAYLATIGF